ncbi:MAG TPA: carcinine hydrolase/isopenicillin-N N-acyltransferase family protein, partial [Spirochaetia bacterium]|nr:carcinine hydrolase/isopenicillin-N N-acyltransferase family protein [Spirochaetia bacterium]
APKHAWYVEGDGWHRGWLLGTLAEPEVSRMAGEFVDNVAFAFFNSGLTSDTGLLGAIKDLMVRIIAGASERMLPDIPAEIIAEIDGMAEGCRAANPRTTVQRERLLALNLGVDCLLAHIYTGTLFAERGVHPRLLRTPVGCNAFSISGDAAGGRHFFGRDFMFPTADVFQDTAGVLVAVPAAGADGRVRPFVSQTAPGLVGSIAAMNVDGVGIGVDMLPSRLCDPSRPGLNSLLLIRDCMQHCSSAEAAVERIRRAPRGVSWLYPVADAAGHAFVVEAGRRLGEDEPFPYFDHVPGHYRRRLPDLAYIRDARARHRTPEPRHGMMVRSHGYRLPDEFVRDWNHGLWKAFDRSWLTILMDLVSDVAGEVKGLFTRRISSLWKQWVAEIARLGREVSMAEAMFAPDGFINPTWTARNCPGPFYFAPQRETRTDVLIATNHCVTPEMRLTSMNEWIALLASGNEDDIQWRYDELNREIRDALADGRPVEDERAWDLINFLRPDGRFPDYYNPGGKKDWRQVQVHGSVTLCELTGRTFKSLFGYYGDEPVSIHLNSYISS